MDDGWYVQVALRSMTGSCQRKLEKFWRQGTRLEAEREILLVCSSSVSKCMPTILNFEATTKHTSSSSGRAAAQQVRGNWSPPHFSQELFCLFLEPSTRRKIAQEGRSHHNNGRHRFCWVYRPAKEGFQHYQWKRWSIYVHRVRVKQSEYAKYATDELECGRNSCTGNDYLDSQAKGLLVMFFVAVLLSFLPASHE
jgi:hypothetical protein